MNILLHIARLGTGGAERQLCYLAEGLAKRGHQVHVVTLYSGGLFWERLAQNRHIRLYSQVRKNRWDFAVIHSLWCYCKKHEIQIILSFLPVSSVIAALPARLLGIPWITGIRASNMRFPVGARLYLWAERLLSNRLASACVANSHAGAEFHKQLGYKKNLLIIPNGLPVPETKFPPPLHATPARVGYIGRLHPMKDIPTLLEALAQTPARVPLRLLIYGAGDTRYSARLQESARALKIRVHWRGETQNVWPVLQTLDIVISSSCYGEGMSNTIMEAMLAGRIVIASDVGDARRMLTADDGQMAGWIVPPSEPEALAKAVTEALAHPEKSRVMAKRAQTIARARYCCETMIERYQALFYNTVNQKPYA